MRTTGRLKNKNIILLPKEWKGKINTESIVVQLTPYGVGKETKIAVLTTRDNFTEAKINGADIVRVHDSLDAIKMRDVLIKYNYHN